MVACSGCGITVQWNTAEPCTCLPGRSCDRSGTCSRKDRADLGLSLAAAITGGIAHALSLAFGMTWEILWALVLGFALSAAVQAVVSKAEMSRLLPDDSPRTLAIACALGAASSSCSYAAVALARSIFRKGANFTAAMAFEFASTNLVIELGVIMIVLMGWQFAAAEFIGGPLMIVIMAMLFKVFLTPRLVEA